MTQNTIINFSDTGIGWQRTFYAFLAEKEQRSSSRRTVEGYSRMLQDFFGRSGKQPDTVTSQDIFVYAHSPGLSGKQPSAITIGARIACISSFFRFLIRIPRRKHSELLFEKKQHVLALRQLLCFKIK